MPALQVIVLGLLALGLGIEAFGSQHGRVRGAGRWMILLGTLASVPAVMSGMYEYYDIVRGEGAIGEPWYRLVREARLSGEQFEKLEHHAWCMAIGTALSLLAVMTFVGGSDAFRQRMRGACLAIAIIAVGVMIAGECYFGGSVRARAAAVRSPLELHVALGGLAVAGALGTSARAMRSAAGGAWFWVAAGMLTLVGFRSGVRLAGLWGAGERVKPLLAQPRDLAHVILGTSIVVLTLGLAGMSRWARHRRRIIVIQSMLLMMALAGEVWVGMLLMFDGSNRTSSVLHFTRPIVQDASRGD